MVEGILYAVRSRLIQLGGRSIGTVSFGLPLSNEDDMLALRLWWTF